MGFTAPRTIYRLTFDEGRYEGLEVRVASVPLGRLLDLADQADRLKAGGPSVGLSDVRELFELFASSLRSWNLQDDDGADVALGMAGLMAQEYSFAVDLIMAWMDAVSGVPDPLVRRSTGGSQLEAPSIPMEALSASPPS